MAITSLTPYSGQTPNKATQTKEEFADNIYATHLFYDNTFVSEMNTTIDDLNVDVGILNNQLIYANYKGDYSGSATYALGDSVTYLGNIWYSKIVGNTGNAVVEGVSWTKPAGIVAATLATPRLINGVSFDGSANINIEARIGTAIASAATTTIGTVGLGELIHITGTTTITSFGTSTQTGVKRTLIFDGILTLTHNATNLKLITNANITTAVGDTMEVVCENHTLGYWKCISYVRATGVPLAADTTKLSLSGGTMTGAVTSLRETKIAMGANAIDLATGNLFTKTITVATTFTLSNIPTTGQAAHFVLELTNGGAFTITWFSGVKWAGGVAPVLTAAGIDILGFYSHDGGTTWRGIVMAKDSK